MSHPSKAKGGRFEIALHEWFQEEGFTCERLVQHGSRDQGDLAVIDGGIHLVVEAKNQQRMKLPEYILQMERERINYMQARNLPPGQVDGIVVINRRMAPIGSSYVFTTLDQFMGVEDARP